MNFNAEEKNENQLKQIKVYSFKGGKKVTSQEGSLASIISFVTALIAVVILFIGAPLINRKSGGFINGSGFGNFIDLWDRNAYNIYDDEQLLLVAALITIFTIISGVIGLLRKNRQPNSLDVVGIGFHILNCVAIIITYLIAFYDKTEFTYGGGIGVKQGVSQQPTFWFVIIAILIVTATVLSIRSYIHRKNA